MCAMFIFATQCFKNVRINKDEIKAASYGTVKMLLFQILMQSQLLVKRFCGIRISSALLRVSYVFPGKHGLG